MGIKPVLLILTGDAFSVAPRIWQVQVLGVGEPGQGIPW